MFTFGQVAEIALFYTGAIGLFLGLHGLLGKKRYSVAVIIASIVALALLIQF